MFIDTDVAEAGKNIIIFSNCHAWIIRHALKVCAPEFKANSAVHVIESFTDDYLQCFELAKSCDIFLYQTEKGEKIERGYNALVEHLPAHAKIIRFPMVGFGVFWPTMFRDYSGLVDENSGKILFQFADRLIHKAWKSGQPANQIIENYLANPPLDHEQLQRSLDLWISGSKAQDGSCDVAATDLVLHHAFSDKTFYWPTHCSNTILFGITDRILNLLGREPLEPTASAEPNWLHDWELPMHPSVINHFKLEYLNASTEYLMADGRHLKIEDYLAEYIAYLPRRYGELVK